MLESNEILYQILKIVITAISLIVGIGLKQLLAKAADWFKAKTGEKDYNLAVDFARGLYILIEDKYADKCGKFGEQKMNEMIDKLQTAFPKLSRDELISINKQVWASFQDGFNGSYSKSAVTSDTKNQ